MIPGEYILDEKAGSIEANAGRRTICLLVRNTGDRPVQIGSHFHFFEVNGALAFDRAVAYGLRLNIPAGTAVRFEPGEDKEIELTEFAGDRIIHGFNGLVEGALGDATRRMPAIDRARQQGFQFAQEKAR
jgi:urease subunit beta